MNANEILWCVTPVFLRNIACRKKRNFFESRARIENKNEFFPKTGFSTSSSRKSKEKKETLRFFANSSVLDYRSLNDNSWGSKEQ
jgi:hypothetical protein